MPEPINDRPGNEALLAHLRGTHQQMWGFFDKLIELGKPDARLSPPMVEILMSEEGQKAWEAYKTEKGICGTFDGEPKRMFACVGPKHDGDPCDFDSKGVGVSPTELKANAPAPALPSDYFHG